MGRRRGWLRWRYSAYHRLLVIFVKNAVIGVYGKN